MRNATRFSLSVPAAVLLLIACATLLLASSAQAADKTGSDPGYEVSTDVVFIKPDYELEDKETERVFVTPSERVDDRIQTPTWKGPEKIRDRAKDMGRIRRIWRWIRRDPGLRREVAGLRSFERGEFHNDPHFMGRNSIPLQDVEQIIVDLPRSIEEKERPMLDMVSTTLGRGIMNTTMGWLEIPRHITKSMRRIDPVTGIVVGTVQGSVWTVVRTVTGVGEIGLGVTDLVRFRRKRPENLEHRPLIMPEWIIKDTWGEPIPEWSDAHGNFDLDTTKEWR